MYRKTRLRQRLRRRRAQVDPGHGCIAHAERAQDLLVVGCLHSLDRSGWPCCCWWWLQGGHHRVCLCWIAAAVSPRQAYAHPRVVIAAVHRRRRHHVPVQVRVRRRMREHRRRRRGQLSRALVREHRSALVRRFRVVRGVVDVVVDRSGRVAARVRRRLGWAVAGSRFGCACWLRVVVVEGALGRRRGRASPSLQVFETTLQFLAWRRLSATGYYYCF